MATLFSLEALQADAGDCLILHFGTKADHQYVLIDGGPDDVFEQVLSPRLEQIGGGSAVSLRLAMVSHIDDDHIVGVRKLLEAMRDGTAPATVEALWHNGLEDALPQDLRAAVPPPEDLPTRTGRAIAAGWGEGKKLGAVLRKLSLEGNPGFDGLVMAGGEDDEPVFLDDLSLRVLAPNQARLDALWKEWRAAIREKKPPATVADFADKSVTNLASIVVLAELEGKSMLLTGDVRGDHLLDGMERAGVSFTRDAPLDILKVPHHGSARNAKVETFEALPARHYVISANGEHENPDLETLEMISKAREGDDDFTLHFTNRAMTFKRGQKFRDIGKELAAFLDAEKKRGRKYKARFREDDEPSLVVDLLSDRAR